ncbi:MAG: class I SAM-dependent methyltransferase [Methylovulum sp.]|uniref:class I SAM-dependent methyltransferase n=1 Tax=Methylovulum sp. TaxID=1916980 RepID=UPI00263A04B6|nr:class I SAM-dependent methyltransferase [Methylovulum sp.]MDD2724826.1 class I SAM-dependent methyltransferase [Methylovulum sp.]MDD5124072.1 class I SAM-dependent methyltransferase [Methylovulum sp.]
MTYNSPYDAMFSGLIGQDYGMLKRLAPMTVAMSHLVGVAVGQYPDPLSGSLKVVELGGGTGITTLSLLMAKPAIEILSVDNEPVMQDQAKQNLQEWQTQGKLAFCTDDALSALTKLADGSVDVVASAYTLHNFTNDYRQQVITEIFRVLKPAGQFVNGDRYALDDIDQHTRTTQAEVSRYFQILIEADKLALLEHWIVHLFSDESANHIMRETQSLQQLAAAGFIDIHLSKRNEVNALVVANKPY